MPSQAGGRRGFGERLLGALKLDATVFEEVEDDQTALPQSVAVVALAAVASALSAGLGGVGPLVGQVVGAFAGWLIGVAIVWGIGVKAMGHSSDFGELMRTTGFASAPQLLLAVGILPIGPLMGLVALGVLVLSLIAYVLAVRHALDVETGTAVGICVAALLARWLLYWIFWIF
jgi:hypothetical protein